MLVVLAERLQSTLEWKAPSEPFPRAVQHALAIRYFDVRARYKPRQCWRHWPPLANNPLPTTKPQRTCILQQPSKHTRASPPLQTTCTALHSKARSKPCGLPPHQSAAQDSHRRCEGAVQRNGQHQQVPPRPTCIRHVGLTPPTNQRLALFHPNCRGPSRLSRGDSRTGQLKVEVFRVAGSSTQLLLNLTIVPPQGPRSHCGGIGSGLNAGMSSTAQRVAIVLRGAREAHRRPRQAPALHSPNGRCSTATQGPSHGASRGSMVERVQEAALGT